MKVLSRNFVNNKKSASTFSRTAGRTKLVNIIPKSMRGGIRF